MPDHLPEIEVPLGVRAQREIEDRLLAMNAVAAVIFGWQRVKAKRWLEREGLTELPTLRERALLDGEPPRSADQDIVDGICALAWVLALIELPDLTATCPPDLVKKLPDLKAEETSQPLRSRARMQPTHELIAQRDLAYCLHWAVVEGIPAVARLGAHPEGIIERRRALEWVLSPGVPWEEVPMDT